MSFGPDPQQQAKQPVTVLAGPYGHPFHPIMVTVPIGAWTASLVFDIASHVTSNPGLLTQGSCLGGRPPSSPPAASRPARSRAS